MNREPRRPVAAPAEPRRREAQSASRWLTRGRAEELSWPRGRCPSDPFTSSEIAELTGSAPASCYAAGFVYLRCGFNSFLFGPLPCMPNDQCNEHSFYNCIE